MVRRTENRLPYARYFMSYPTRYIPAPSSGPPSPSPVPAPNCAVQLTAISLPGAPIAVGSTGTAGHGASPPGRTTSSVQYLRSMPRTSPRPAAEGRSQQGKHSRLGHVSRRPRPTGRINRAATARAAHTVVGQEAHLGWRTSHGARWDEQQGQQPPRRRRRPHAPRHVPGTRATSSRAAWSGSGWLWPRRGTWTTRRLRGLR